MTQSGHGTLGGANLNRNVAHPELGGGNETARFHNTIGWFRGLMAAYVACPVGGDASEFVTVPAINSSSQRRPFAIACRDEPGAGLGPDRAGIQMRRCSGGENDLTRPF